MNYTKEALTKSGLTHEKLKSMCENLDSHAEFKKLVELMASRIQDGVDRNLGDYRHWWALEKAHDAPFYQVSFTLLRDLVEKDYDGDKVLDLLNDYGLAYMLQPVLKPDGTCELDAHGKEKKALNIPIFFQVFVPLCQAYKTVRWAKLFNDRDQTPLYRYDPAYSTKDNRLRCEIWTSRASIMAQQYGYVNDEKQAIFQMLHYGICLKFIREAWHREQQEVDGKEKIVREGLRFHLPTPDRFYYDLNDRLSTLNSDSGTSYLGYWYIDRYRDVANNQDYWNTDKISYGGDVDIIGKSPNFFATIYPCALRFPPCVSTESGPGAPDNDRERAAVYYGSDNQDSAVLLCQHFERIVPKDWGISDYKYPIWMRFVMANKNVPIYAEPIFCTPAAYYGYDADNNRRLPSSMTLELMPWQDHMGNLLSQWIYSVKQNLAAPVFVDREVVPLEAINKLKNLGEKSLRGITYIDFSSSDLQAQLADKREAFFTPQLPKHNTGELRMLMMGILDVLERALQFSPQETGQAASHEQSATESTIINNNIGNRVRFTGSGVDDGIWATKKMVYDATVANADDNIFAEVTGSYADTYEEFVKLAEKVGVEIIDRETSQELRQMRVMAPKHKLLVEAFSTSRDADQRPNNPGIASAAAQVLQAFASNEVLLMSVGPAQIIELTNVICSLLGLPKDFRLKFTPPKDGMAGGQEMMQQMGEQLKALAEQVAQRIQQSEKAAAQAIQQMGKQAVQASQQATQQQLERMAEPLAQRFESLEQAVQQGQQVIEAVAQRQQQPQPPQQIPVPVPVPVPMNAAAT